MLTAEPLTSSVVTFDHVEWDTYEHLLRDLRDQRWFLTYDRGRLEIMAPAMRHERGKKLLARLIETLTLELNIPLCSAGSTTCRREDLLRGLEPDECYYIQNEPAVRGLDELDLSVHPAPDLAIEVDVTSSSSDRLSIYATLRVGELWRLRGGRVEMLVLRDNTYSSAAASRAFPFLKSDDVQRFLDLRGKLDENQIVREFQRWAAAQKR